MSLKRLAQEECDSPGEVQELRREVKLALEHSQASTMNAVRDMMAEFTRNNDRSESGSAEGSAGVGQIPRGTVPTAVRETPAAAGAAGMARGIAAEQETYLREGASRNLGATGRGGTALPVEVGPPRGQPDQPERIGEWGAYPGGELSGGCDLPLSRHLAF